jgi:uncharacterized membrane protein YbhN (UPF0104 family)
VASVLISAALLYYLLSQIEMRQLAATFTDLHWPSLALFVSISAAGLVARSLRYWLLLAGKIRLWPLMLVTLVRNLFVDLLPARIGSLSYIYMVTTRCGLPLDEALASFFLAFVFDIVAIAPLLLLALLVVGGALPGGAGILAGLAALLLVGCLIALYLMGPALRLAARLLSPQSPAGAPPDSSRAGSATAATADRAPRSAAAWLERLAHNLTSTADQVDASWRRGVALPVFSISIVVRLCKFGAYYCLLHAVLVPNGYTWGTLSFPMVFLGVAGAELSATLPIHSLAGFGTYEAAWTLGFTQLGLPTEIAVLSGFATHLLSQIHDYGLGLLAFLWIMRPRPDRPPAPSATRTGRSEEGSSTGA